MPQKIITGATLQRAGQKAISWRTVRPRKFAPERNGVLYCSKEAHYSVPKAGKCTEWTLS